MLERVEHTDYDLVMNISGSWTLKGSDTILFYGTLKEVVTHMVRKCNFELSEIKFALEDMEVKGHTRAHFGMFKSLIFTADADTLTGVA
jgi:hypothetical protein